MAACSSRPSPIIEERKVLTQREIDERIGGDYVRVVQSGDTLYSIAFEAGLDVQKIAVWNGIKDTSTIIAGQRIRLTEPSAFQSVSPQVTKKNVARPSRSKSVGDTRALSRVSKEKKPVSKASSLPSKSASKVGQANRMVSKNVEWDWPIRGSIVATFNPKARKKGLDIQGQLGQLVKASSAGEIVYAGDSLKGYGNLIIVKHSDEFLSAYANNATIKVREGQLVVQGQAIATLGTDSTGGAVAHFQIRRHGNPVDPSSYLP